MGGGVGEESEVGVQGAHQMVEHHAPLHGCAFLQYLSAESLGAVECLVEVADAGVREVNPPGFDHVAEGLHSVCSLLDIHLVGM